MKTIETYLGQIITYDISIKSSNLFNFERIFDCYNNLSQLYLDTGRYCDCYTQLKDYGAYLDTYSQIYS